MFVGSGYIIFYTSIVTCSMGSGLCWVPLCLLCGTQVQGLSQEVPCGGMFCLVVGHTTHICITESVDSVCRDGTDMPYVAVQTEAWKTLLKQQL